MNPKPKEITEIEKLIKTAKQVDVAKHEVYRITEVLFEYGKNIIQYTGFHPNWDNGKYYEEKLKKLHELNDKLANWEWRGEADKAKSRLDDIRTELKL